MVISAAWAQQTATQDRATARTFETRDQAAGHAGKLVVIPWQLAKFEDGSLGVFPGTVTLDIEKSRLMQAPSFTHEQLTQWLQQGQSSIAAVDQFFNVREQRAAARPDLNRQAVPEKQKKIPFETDDN